jgi:hypothetical protein
METEVRDKRVPLQTVLDAVKRADPQDKLLSVRFPRAPRQTYLLRVKARTRMATAQTGDAE